MKRILFAMLLALLAFSCSKQNNHGSSGGLVIKGVSPDSGVATSIVTITGGGFDTVTANDVVTFNGKPAAVQSATPTILTVMVPDTTDGPVAISVGGKQITGPVYHYQKLSLDSLSPTQGGAGQLVTITGLGLIFSSSAMSLQPHVTFNGRVANVASFSGTKLVVEVPDSAGTGPVVMALGDQQASFPAFTYFFWNNVSPLTGGAGTVMTIYGYFGSNPTNVQVSIGGKAATVNNSSTGFIVVSVPPGVTGSAGRVIVSVNGGVVNGPKFTYVAPPTVSSIVPTSGPAGTTVTITGTSFSSIDSQNVVTIKGVPAAVSQASATQLTVTVPAGATTGAVAVNVNGQAVTGPVFTVQNLGVFSVTPASAPPGTPVTITGVGFNSTPGLNQVTFNGTPATVTSATATQLVVTTPPSFTPGMLVVTTGGLTASWPFKFDNYTPGVFTFAGGSLNYSQFRSPVGLAIDANDNVYVADEYFNNIQMITPQGVVTTFAGSGSYGLVNGPGAAAQFEVPIDLAFDQQGNLYVAEQGNNNDIRVIDVNGNVSTFVTLTDPPGGVAVDAHGNVWVTDNTNGNPNVYEYNSSARLINTLVIKSATQLERLVVDASGTVYTADYANVIYKNGSPFASGVGLYGSNKGVCLDNSGNLVATGTNEVFLINLQQASPQLIAGQPYFNGYQDGPLATSIFNNPIGVRVDSKGNIYVADQYNGAIRKIVLP